MKTSHITNRLGLGPFLDGSHFFKIRRNSINRNYKFEEVNLCSEKGTLNEVSLQLFFSQNIRLDADGSNVAHEIDSI